MPEITDPRLLQQLNGAGQPAPITIGRPNVRKEAREDAQLGVSQGQLGVAQGNLAARQATLPSEVAKAEADARKAQIEADRAAAEAAKAPKPETSLIQQSLKTSALMNALNTARAQIGKGWATGNMAGTKGFQGVPFVGQNSTNLAATLDGLKGSILTDTLATMKAQSATGASGMGSLTEKEGERLAASVGALQQAQDAESLTRNLAKVEMHYRNMLALSYGEDPRRPEVAQRYGIISDEDRAAAEKKGAGQVTAAGNEDVDPAMIGANNAVRRMIRNGASEQEIRGYLNAIKPGVGDAVTGLSETINYSRQNPDKPVGVNIERQWTPSGGVSGALGEIGMSPLGAGVIGAADMLTGSNLDSLTSNPDLARATMAGVQERNPWSYFGGQVGGAALGGLGLELGAAKAGLGGLNAARGSDLAYGALIGAGQADDPGDSRVAGALLGAGAGLTGGMAGRGLARGAGRLVSGVTDPVVRALNDAGVRLTPGQMAGGTLARTEDRLAGLPIVGDQIQARRLEGVQDFNRAVFDEALAPISANTGGMVGQAGVNASQDATGAAYRAALGGSQVMPDVQFSNDLGAAVSGLRAVPRVGEEVTDTVGTILNPNPARGASYFDPATGSLSGENVQPLLQELRGVRTGYAMDPLGNRVGQGVSGVENAIEGMFQRQAPDVMPAYNAANEAYRNSSVVEDAVLAALNNSRAPGVFTPAQLGQASRANTKRFGGKRAAARGDMPFNDIQKAAQQVLPTQIPDSGTAGRAVIPLVAGGLLGGGGAVAGEGAEEKAGYGASGALIGALLASAPYSAASRAALQRVLLTERPDALQRAGGIIMNNDTIAGLLAAPALAGQVTQ